MACDWSCDKCTLVNPPSADTCEACGMTRPASCPASPTRGQDWECHMCTFLNQRSSAVCYACDSVKEETAVVTPAPAPVLPKSSLLDPSKLPPAPPKSPGIKSPGPGGKTTKKSNKKKQEPAKSKAKPKSPWQQIADQKAQSGRRKNGGSSTSKQ